MMFAPVVALKRVAVINVLNDILMSFNMSNVTCGFNWPFFSFEPCFYCKCETKECIVAFYPYIA